MDYELIKRVIESPDEDTIETLFDDYDTVVWVDWGADDREIVDDFESILQTGKLSAEAVSANTDAGYELFITYGDERVKVPIVCGGEDRHITIVTLNEVLAPEYEIRFCIDSNGSDTLGFLPLPSSKWRELEEQYDGAVAKRFYRLKTKPNLFTDDLPF